MSLDALIRHRPGEVRRITSASNDVIKAIRALELRKHRAESGLFVAEGARTVIEALELGADIMAIAYLDDAREEAHVAHLAAEVGRRGGLVLEVNAQALEKISRRDNPQTVIGVFRQAWRSLADIDLAGAQRIIVLEEVRDPGNLGTILRTADGFGVKAVILIGDSTDPYGLDAVRASMGSIFAVALARTPLDAFLHWRATGDALMVGTHLSGAVDLRTVPWRDPSLIVMGNEQRGLSPPLAEACDVLARIPMSGRADSFNLAVATAITLWDSVRGT